MEADLIIAGTSVSTLIVSSIQLCRSFLPTFTKKAAPCIAISLGLIICYFYNLDTHSLSIFQMLFMGVSIGFQSIGIYASTTSSIKEEKKQVEVQLQQLSAQHTVLVNQVGQAQVLSKEQQKNN